MVEILEAEATRVRDFKITWLINAGFSIENAQRIADSNVDWHFAIDTLSNGRAHGYDEEFVVKLLL